MRLLLLASTLLLAQAALAQQSVLDPGAPWQNTDMTRASAMGGAHVAIATGNDALIDNAAGLAQAQRYHFQVDGALDSAFPAQALILSVVDSTSVPYIGSGLLFERLASGQPDGRGEGWLAGVGYSYPSGGFSIGGMTKYVRARGPGGDFTHQFMEDFGLLARRGDFSYGLAVHNLSLSPVPLFPLNSSAGIAWGNDADYHLAFDYKADFSDFSKLKHTVNGGFELLIGQSFPIRLGASWDISHHLTMATFGAGILTQGGGLQFAYRKRIHGQLGADQVLEAGVTIYLE